MFGLLGQILNVLWEGLRPFFEDFVYFQDPKVKLENQLRVLYGRGDISKERFFEKLNQLRWGQIGQGDIQMLYQEARLRRRLQAGQQNVLAPVVPPHAGPASDLERLYLDRGIAEELRTQIEECRRALAEEASWIEEQVRAAQESARSALPEESEARAYLEVWQELLGLAQTYDVQLQAQAEDLRRLDLLEAELTMHISQMKVLEARERFAELRLRIHQDLYPRGHGHLPQ